VPVCLKEWYGRLSDWCFFGLLVIFFFGLIVYSVVGESPRSPLGYRLSFLAMIHVHGELDSPVLGIADGLVASPLQHGHRAPTPLTRVGLAIVTIQVFLDLASSKCKPSS